MKTTNPNQPSKSELIRLSMSEKNGMIWMCINIGASPRELEKRTSAMMNAKTHVVAIIPTHDAQPTKVFECKCLDPRNARKKIKRAVTDEYSAPRKTIVGIANENAIFLYGSCREPKAGAVM
jgi:hypothetical protein